MINKSIDINLGYKCNNNCIFCVRGNKRKKGENKKTEEVKTIINKIKNSCQEIIFTGGEPTIRNDLIELVDFADKFNFERIQIQSNGRRFAYKSFCKALIEAGANEFGLSLHGSNSKTHDRLTRTNGSFKQSVKGIKNLKSLNQCVAVNCVITKTNFKEIPKIADLLINLKVDQYQFTFPYINNYIKSNEKIIEEFIAKKSDIIPHLKKGIQKGVDSKTPVLVEAIPPCFLPNYKNKILDFRKNKLKKVYIDEEGLADYEQFKKKNFKIKSPKCMECACFNKCEGPWKEYPKIFSWEEFEPIK